jgi:glutamate racemase
MRSATVIGFFDSGIGGISIWRAVHQRLPGCPTLYVADNEHCPYGPRAPQEIRRFSRAITRFLVAQGAGLIVVACNTASAAALRWLRARFDVPVVGMEPAVKPAASRTRSGHIGVLATQGTLSGDMFRTTSARHASGVTLHVQIGHGLVERVESGQAESPETEQMLRYYLEPMLQAGVDQIVLGCTHYFFLLPAVKRIVPGSVSVIDPADAVARQVERLLLADSRCAVAASDSRAQSAPTGRSGPCAVDGATVRFFATGCPGVLESVLRSATGQDLLVEQIVWRNGRLDGPDADRVARNVPKL